MANDGIDLFLHEKILACQVKRDYKNEIIHMILFEIHI